MMFRTSVRPARNPNDCSEAPIRPPALLSGSERCTNPAERMRTPDLLFLSERKRMWGLHSRFHPL